MPIPDTAIINDCRIVGWFYTSKEGIICRASAHEVSGEALLHKLLTQQVISVSSNPFTYVAVAHYSSGIARLMRRPELQALVCCSSQHGSLLILLCSALQISWDLHPHERGLRRSLQQ